MLIRSTPDQRSLPGGRVRRRASFASAPDDEVGFRVIGAGQPCRSASLFPTVSAPAFRTFLAWRGDGIEAPAAGSGFCIVSIEESADSVFAAANPGDDHVFDCQRSACDGVARSVIS